MGWSYTSAVCLLLQLLLLLLLLLVVVVVVVVVAVLQIRQCFSILRDLCSLRVVVK